MYTVYFISKITKTIALVSLAVTFFSDLLIFKILCSLIFVSLVLEFPLLKCFFLQIIGMGQIKKQYGKNLPSVDNFKSSVEYALPFHGRWVVVNGCFSQEYSHSWNIPTQRYAYDFIMLDETGASYHGAFQNCNDYYCYNKDILAPADGVVVEVVNNAQDTLIFPKGNFFSKARHIAGNYIIIRHGEKEYSTLAHLKKNSILVKTDQAVSKGERIAACGNTGNSSEPHLHFQLQTGQNFYNSAGLPIPFSDIHLSEVNNYECFDPRPHLSDDQIPEGFLTRGFAVENKA